MPQVVPPAPEKQPDTTAENTPDQPPPVNDASGPNSETGEPVIQTPLQQLMYGLIYPAVLGTGITMTAVRAAHHHSIANALLDPSIEVGFIAGLFFCASFDSAFYWPLGQKGHYRKSAFGIDFLEVILMFVCFHFLRLFEEPKDLLKPDLFYAYLMLGIDVLLQFGWRKVVGLDPLYRWHLRLGIAVVLFVGCLWGDSQSCVNIMITIAVSIAVAIYVFFDPRYPRKSNKTPSPAGH